jgi:hypothetical protein
VEVPSSASRRAFAAFGMALPSLLDAEREEKLRALGYIE